MKEADRDIARDFIRQNWGELDGTALGVALGIRSTIVSGLRRELGLYRSRGGVADVIDWSDLRRAVEVGGIGKTSK